MEKVLRVVERSGVVLSSRVFLAGVATLHREGTLIAKVANTTRRRLSVTLASLILTLSTRPSPY